jgi:HD-GYP domain-containing protein (c-di-GMP phosphodiesterase class II)
MVREGICDRAGNVLAVSGLDAYAAALDVCDPDLGGHAARVGAFAGAIARRLGWDDDRLDDVRLGAALHDVGKIAIPPEILQKPTALDPDELAQIRAHPVEGTWLIAGVRSLVRALPYVLFHHERWDGAGYPTRRAGTEIPLEGRVLAVADAFDAMTSARPYRDTVGLEEALEEVARCAGSQFDPVVAQLFLEAWGDGELTNGSTPLAATA